MYSALILGGEEFPHYTELSRWLPKESETLKQRIFNIYGTTEVSCWSTIYEVQRVDYRRIPIGQPLDKETALRVVEPHTNNVLIGCCQGELQIVSRTRKCLVLQADGKLKRSVLQRTGDLVEVNETGELFYLGRLNSVIKRFGKRICLDELSKRIEEIISENLFQAVQCVCLFEDNKLIGCFRWLEHDDVWHKIKLLLKQSLASFEVPDFYQRLDQMPLSAHNKINMQKLKEILAEKSLRVNISPLSIFTHFMRHTLGLKCTINAEKEKRRKTALDVSFTAAGGTSFQALSLATEIQAFLPAGKQSQLLEMLLSEQEILKNILLYLEKMPTIPAYPGVRRVPNENLLQVQPIWYVDLERCVDSSPTGLTLPDGRHCVCVGSHSKTLLTVHALTGDELSRLQLNDRIECRVVFVTIEGKPAAVVGCYAGFLYVFDFVNGSILWQLHVGGMIKASPLFISSNQTLIVASYAADFNLMCICLKTKRSIWKLRLGEKGIYATPVHLQQAQACLVCTLDGTVARIKTTDGTIEWKKQYTTPIFSMPVELLQESGDSILFIAEVSGQVHCCRGDNGLNLHGFSAGGNIFSGMQIKQLDKKGSLILFGCHDNCVYCLKYETSLELFWKFPMNSPVFATPVLFTNNMGAFDVLICSTKGQIGIVSLSEATLQHSFELKGEIFSTPYYNNNHFYIGCRDNFLYGFCIK